MVQCGSLMPLPHNVLHNANRTGSMGKRTRLRVSCKFQIVCLPVDPTLYTFSKTAHEKGMGDQPWTASLCVADSVITSVSF